jgi:hypothetical protein
MEPNASITFSTITVQVPARAAVISVFLVPYATCALAQSALSCPATRGIQLRSNESILVQRSTAQSATAVTKQRPAKSFRL